MKLKSFDEFLSTISDDDYNKILEDSVNAINKRSDDVSTATDSNDIVLLQNIFILRRYHAWLSEQIEPSPDH